MQARGRNHRRKGWWSLQSARVSLSTAAAAAATAATAKGFLAELS